MRKSVALGWLGLAGLAITTGLAGCSGGEEGSGNPGGADVSVVRSSVAHDTAPSVTDAQYAQLVAGSNQFGLSLLAEVMPPDENFIFSPTSAQVALAMTYAGARGTTADGMRTALSDTLPEGVYHTATNRMLIELLSRNRDPVKVGNDTKRIELSLADAIWTQRDLALEEPFLATLSREYDAGVSTVDFTTQFEPARHSINLWVEHKTHERIVELLPAGSIDSFTRLVLVNALYFYGSWATVFEPEATGPGSFTRLDGGTVSVPTMHGSEIYGAYAKTDEVEVAELPYLGEELRMTIVLPAVGQFAAVQAKVSASWLDEACAGIAPQTLSVSLPKFTIHPPTYSLKAGLAALGMETAFTEAADFSGITTQQNLFIDDVLQQAFIAVDEAGMEAAAATAVIMTLSGAPVTVPFVVDRPFLFFVRDASGLVLFGGQVVDPSA
jgi:serpin B